MKAIRRSPNGGVEAIFGKPVVSSTILEATGLVSKKKILTGINSDTNFNQPKNKNQERSGSRLDSLSKQLPTTNSLATIRRRKAENQKQVKQSAYIITNKKILGITSIKKNPTFKQVYIHYFAVQLC